MRKAQNLFRGGVRNVLKSAFSALWTIEGESGIYQYVAGCKKDHQPGEGEIVAAINNDSTAIFKRDEAVMKIMEEALGK